MLQFTDNLQPRAHTLAIICASKEDNPLLKQFDLALEGHLAREMALESFLGNPGQKLEIHTLGRLPFSRLMLIGGGIRSSHTAESFLILGQHLGDIARKRRWPSLAVIPDTNSQEPTETLLEPLCRGLLLGGYRFERYRRNESTSVSPCVDFQVVVPSTFLPSRPVPEPGLVDAICMARDLTNEPPGSLTPTELANHARILADREGLELEVLDKAACAAWPMNLLLSVSSGSREPPSFIHLTHRPKDKPQGPKVALIGKGITFDSGGLSLKTTTGMKSMKSDMAGGAVVLAVMGLAGRNGLPLEVHGLIPACENMPSGSAYRVGDVLQSRDGPSVEIVNTDAEGRLVLADAITFARNLGCRLIIDLATLTGACVVALGEETAGVMSNDKLLTQRLLDAAARHGESMWPLPLLDNLQEKLKSSIADCKNAGGRQGAAITAALFLQKFIQDERFIHIDLAGPSFREKASAGRPAGGTGFGVATVFSFLKELVTIPQG